LADSRWIASFSSVRQVDELNVRRDDNVSVKVRPGEKGEDMFHSFLSGSIDLPFVFGGRVHGVGPGVGSIGEESKRIQNQDEGRAPI
jgi:hypothetical protein